MKQHNRRLSRVLAVVALVATVGAPQFTLLRSANAQDRTINVNELDFRALGIDNEARQIISLVGAHVKFFKRSSDLQGKGIVSPRDASDFKNEGDQRKSDLVTLKRELESLINKLKQKNHWNDAFDAQFLAGLKTDSDRSLLTQAGGARKLFQAAVDDVSTLREDIDSEVRQVNSKQTGALRNRANRVFAAHARPPAGKVCTILLTAILAAKITNQILLLCPLVRRYNAKGCIPGPAVEPRCS